MLYLVWSTLLGSGLGRIGEITKQESLDFFQTERKIELRGAAGAVFEIFQYFLYDLLSKEFSG